MGPFLTATDTKELTTTYPDLVFEARVRGQPALVRILIEHQSSCDPWMALRMSSTAVRLQEAWVGESEKRRKARRKKLPVVYSVVLFHGGRWTAARDVVELLHMDEADREVLEGAWMRYRYAVVPVDDIADARIQRIADAVPFAGVCLHLAKHGAAEDLPARISAWTPWYRRLDIQQLATALMYAMRRCGDHQAIVAAAERLRPGVGAMVKSDWERTMERRYGEGVAVGRAEGRAEGRSEGIASGVREVLIDLLAARFGEVPAAARKRIEGASAESLARWARRVVTAGTIDEVFAE